MIKVVVSRGHEPVSARSVSDVVERLERAVSRDILRPPSVAAVGHGSVADELDDVEVAVGLTMELSRERLNAAATTAYRSAADNLGKSCGSAACETVCGRQASAIDAEFAAVQEAGAVVACAPGCNFCCHQRVGVLPHEAIALFGYLRTRIEPAVAALIERRILENAGRIDGLTVREHQVGNVQCAFLIDGQCSAYEARPSACATYHSLSRERCEYSFNHPQDIGTPKNSRPALLELQVFCDALLEASRAGVEAAGLKSTKGELHQLVRTLIEDPSALERWCAGGEIVAA